MTYAQIQLTTEAIEEAIPRPGISSGPAYEKFRERIHKSHYNEFMWFPYSKECFVNCWKDDGKKKDVISYPRDPHVEAVGLYVLGLITSSLFLCLPPTLQADIFSSLTMASMDNKPATCTVPDALHFWRGIHGMSLYNYELDVPLVESKENPGLPDLYPVQKLWWDNIDLIQEYKKKGECPFRLSTEFRVVKNSSSYLSPASGNEWTLTIEVLSFNTPYQEFMDACQVLTDRWMLGAPRGPSRPRPHWAKMYQGLKFNGKPALDYIKQDAYIINGVNHLEKFKEIRSQLNPDPKNMFSNELLDSVFDWSFQPEEEKKRKNKLKKTTTKRIVVKTNYFFA